MDQFDQSKIQEIQQTFDLYDKTGNGEIDHYSVGEAIRSLGFNPTQLQLGKLLNNPELKNLTSQFVKLQDFYPMVVSAMQAEENTNDEEFVEALKVFDRDGSGVISSAELRYALGSMGDMMSKQEIDKLVNEFEDSTGSVNYSEFVRKINEPNRLI